MRDREGRIIDYLRLSLTTACNLRCSYCMPEAGISPLHQHDRGDVCFLAQVSAELGVRRIRLTGGEPLLVPELPQLVHALACTAGIQEVTLTTNGVLLQELAGELKEAGLARVNLSIDSLRADRYQRLTRGGDLLRALRGLEASEMAGLTPVKVNCVVMGGINDDEIWDFAALTINRNISVRFIELMPFGEAVGWPSERYISASEIKERLGLSIEDRVTGGGPAKVYRLPGAVGTIGLITGNSQHFCGSCNRLRITAAGRVRPCLFSDFEIDILPFIKGRDKAGLKDALNGAVLGKPVREGHIHKRRMAEIGG